jgi:hypothetical protein
MLVGIVAPEPSRYNALRYQQEGVLRNATALVLMAEVSRKREHLNT